MVLAWPSWHHRQYNYNNSTGYISIPISARHCFHQSQTPTILGCQLVKQMNLLGPGPIFTTSFEAYYCSSTGSAATSKRLLTREAELCLQSATQRYFHCNCKGGHSLGDRQWPCRSDCVRGKSGHFSSCIKALLCAVDSSSLLSDINH